ncbi:MAG: hypothetical protein IPO32_18260 [Crocinitomicaceae bacterium]|nr:hypothetical protein [Crocinitomicaceae bacterium]
MQNLFAILLLILATSKFSHAQFTTTPSGTSQAITGLDWNHDTLYITSQYGYFGKMPVTSETVIPMIPIGPSGYTIIDFQVKGEYYYAMAVQGSPYQHNYALKSIDYGQTWDQLYDTVGSFYSFTMADTTFGIMGGTFGGFAMTTGSDTSWIMDTLYNVLSASAFYDDSTMIIMSMGGFSFRTSNQGQSWIWGYCDASRHVGIQYLNKDTIYSISYEGTSSPHGYFSKSLNGGANFVTTYIGHNSTTSQYEFTSRVFDLYFDTPNHGYLLGYIYDSTVADVDQMVIFETNDYGETWNPHLTGFSEVAYAMEFVNDSIAFIGGDNGLLIKWNTNIPFADELSLEENHEQNQIQIYPNPADEILTVESDLPIEFVEIIDMSGRVVMRVNVEGKKSAKFFS